LIYNDHIWQQMHMGCISKGLAKTQSMVRGLHSPNYWDLVHMCTMKELAVNQILHGDRTTLDFFTGMATLLAWPKFLRLWHEI